MARRAVFLDRDGTLLQIIHRPDHVKKLTAPFKMSEYRLEEGVHVALADVSELGFKRILISNQPDVAHGYLDEGEWFQIHSRFLNEVPLEDWYICRHTSLAKCPCKKPSPVMLKVAADKYGIDLTGSFMVGDTDKDMEAGCAAGCQTILLDRWYNKDAQAHFRVPNLREAVKIIAAEQEKWSGR